MTLKNCQLAAKLADMPGSPSRFPFSMALTVYNVEEAQFDGPDGTGSVALAFGRL
jgi:hypothetical protein